MELLSFIFFFSILYLTQSGYIRHPGDLHYVHEDGKINTLAWGLKLNSPTTDSTSLATKFGLINVGAVGRLNNYFIFAHPMYYNSTIRKADNKTEFQKLKAETERLLQLESSVVWYKQEIMRHRTKRNLISWIKDPYFAQQWHLHNDRRYGFDLNVTGLWKRNITGRGITVSVIDDGLEWTNKDLKNNYNEKGSWDLNENDRDPMPSKDGSKNEHGTRCAGEIAAERNEFCGVGVAYEAGISGIKVLDGKMTDSMEATAFNMKLETNDIYSCSWGPQDDGETIDGPHHLTSMALEHGVDRGRGGYGAIYVVASGNGGLTGDNCNFDGYANSVYTVTIGAVDEFGNIPYYAEECPAMLAVTLSSGGKGYRDIVTTDWTAVDGTGCTTQHSTSAAAPLAAAVIALMLQVRFCLSWRDIQYLIAITSVQINENYHDWYENAAGLFHSNHYGFGLLSAWRLVSASKVWSSVPFMSTFSSGILQTNEVVDFHPNHTNLTYNLTEQAISTYFIWIMEYVRVRITVQHPMRGQLELRLRCPSGSETVLAKPRINDKLADGYKDWTFTTVRCWGEKPVGQWSFILTDHGKSKETKGVILQWELIIYGTPMTTSEFKSRIRLAREATENNVLDDANHSLPCPQPLKHLGEEIAVSDKILQILCFSGGFLFFLAVFETLEYIFCYDEEKKKFYEESSSRCGKIVRQPRKNNSQPLESTPLMSVSENDGVTCLEMSNPDVGWYRGCDLKEEGTAVMDRVCDDDTVDDSVVSITESIVKDLPTSNT